MQDFSSKMMGPPINNTPGRLAIPVGRFAPSPTGPLHMGSLVTALASYMITKSHGGRWLVRIEDLDPPREVAGSAAQILSSLEGFGLLWDGEVVYQSQRQSLYRQKLLELVEQKIVYFCDCSRKDVENRNKGVYDGRCRSRLLSKQAVEVMQEKRLSPAIRIIFPDSFESFDDRLRGACCFSSPSDQQDFVLQRRDGLVAYQLAVVCDDVDQGVDHLVRGMDIIDSTPRQNYLYHCLQKPRPDYYHIPLVLDQGGRKLGKSSGAMALDQQNKSSILLQAFCHLGQKTNPSMQDAKVEELITYFLKNWCISSLQQRK